MHRASSHHVSSGGVQWLLLLGEVQDVSSESVQFLSEGPMARNVWFVKVSNE